MKTPDTLLRRAATLALAGALSLSTAAAQAATITIVNNDGAGEGFNDPTVVAPAPGNPATTRGGQRLFIFQYAANIWGALLPSAVTIAVNSQFNPLTCTATSATLGSTGATTIHANFPGAPYPSTWYVQSLANRLAGSDLSAQNDMNSTFNSTLDNGSASCLGGEVWYYGTDGNEGINVELLPVVLHELGHGLGFATTTSGSTGNYSGTTPNIFPSIYDHFLYDAASNLHWDQNTATQRKNSAISTTGLLWDGPSGVYGAASFLANRPRMLVNSPGGIAGAYACNNASFGAALTLGGLTGNVVLADDGTAPDVNDGCEALVNGPAIAGNIALVKRGTCTFVIKAAALQAAGATGVIIMNNAAGALSPGGSDPTITIPVVGITQADGNTLIANLGSGVNVTLGLDPSSKAGADNAGRIYMYAPSAFASGSSVSHWDVSLTPNALMEPAINSDLHDNLDIAKNLMVDIGWMDQAVATQLARFTADDRQGGILLAWEFTDLSNVGAVTVERAISDQGPWEPVAVSSHSVDTHTEAIDATVANDVTYFYRLSVMDRAGQVSSYGLIAARHSSTPLGATALFAPNPNPARNGAAFTFRLAQPEFVRLAIVDAAGRTVRTLHNAMQTPGEHTLVWDGIADNGGRAAPGLYFVTLRTSVGLRSQRLAVVH